MPHNDEHTRGTTGTSQPSGTTRPMWNQHSQKYRSEWTSRHPNMDWNNYEHAFRFGWEGSFYEGFRDKDFSAVERDIEREWPNRYGMWPDYTGNKVEGAWQDFKDTVREGWDAARREFNKVF